MVETLTTYEEADAWNGAAVNLAAKYSAAIAAASGRMCDFFAASDAWASTWLCAEAILAVPRRVCSGDCGGGQVVVYGGAFVGKRCGCVLRVFWQRLDECVTALAAVDAWASTRLCPAAILAVPCRVCGGDCGGGRVEVCGGAFFGKRCGCRLRVFWRRLDECAAAIAAADECLCTLAAAIAAAKELK